MAEFVVDEVAALAALLESWGYEQAENSSVGCKKDEAMLQLKIKSSVEPQASFRAPKSLSLPLTLVRHFRPLNKSKYECK